MKYGYYLFVTAVCFLMTGCRSGLNSVQLTIADNGGEHDYRIVSDSVRNRDSDLPIPKLSSELKHTVACNANKFGLKLFRALRESDDYTQKNFLVSPYSMFDVFSMSANGDTAETRRKILEILECGDVSVDSLNVFNLYVASSLYNDKPDVKCELANSFWLRRTRDIVPSFQKKIEAYYNASVSDKGPWDEAGVECINKWVEDHTFGMIKDFFESPEPSWSAVLANTAYFYAAWKDKFLSLFTFPEEFKNIESEIEEVDMMNRSGTMSYYESGGVRAVVLPYIDNNFEMAFILPPEGESITAFCDSLTTEDLLAIFTKTDLKYIDLYLPKFSHSNRGNAVGCIKEMAKGDLVFNEFMQKVPFKLTDVLYGVSIQVSEGGTKAAAVSTMEAMVMESDAASFMSTMRFNRPFIYCIREKSTGLILFLGQMVRK